MRQEFLRREFVASADACSFIDIDVLRTESRFCAGRLPDQELRGRRGGGSSVFCRISFQSVVAT